MLATATICRAVEPLGEGPQRIPKVALRDVQRGGADAFDVLKPLAAAGRFGRFSKSRLQEHES